MSQLPTGTVTLLLADVQGSTRLWESQPTEMADACRHLDTVVSQCISTHGGVRPVEQGEGDSFVAAFARATDAVACAVAIHRAVSPPILLRMGIHTGEVALRDESNYAGPVINRAARLRDLAHGGQTVLSTATESLVVDHLPEGAWTIELGTHRLRDLPRAERVLQLCHRDLENTFPPLRTTTVTAGQNFPAQLTRFIGRQDHLVDVRRLLATHQLVTLTGAGGIGKTRLAAQLGSSMTAEFSGGTWFVDLATVTGAESVPIALARALGLPDQPGRTTLDTLTHSVGEQSMLVVLDNCEHLVDSVASIVTTLLGRCPQLVVMATSRESLNVGGEVTWRLPPLPLATEAVELFIDRARRVNPQLPVSGGDIVSIADICRRLDGMPLAIELAAARSRSLSLSEIAAGLHDRFRLLTGGARTAVRRHQTMRASVEWSYGLLTDSERTMFRRLAVFAGGCDLAAVEAVTAAPTTGDIERAQVLDLVTLLVDKSLVLTENASGITRYRMAETMRQFAAERLHEHDDADAVRQRHCDYYTDVARALDASSVDGHRERVHRAARDMDNLLAAFVWSRDSGAGDRALRLTSSLQPIWLGTGRILEGMAWFDTALADAGAVDATSQTRAWALANRAILAAHLVAVDFVAQAEQALALARDVGDDALVARALTACGAVAAYDADVAAAHLREARSLARSAGDVVGLGQVLAFSSYAAATGEGDPTAALRYGREGCDIADLVGDSSAARWSRWSIGDALYMNGECAESVSVVQALIDAADSAHDVQARVSAQILLAYPLASLGLTEQARTTAADAVESSAQFGPWLQGLSYGALATAALAAGDTAAAVAASSAATERLGPQPAFAHISANPAAIVALLDGRTSDARAQADAAVAARRGWHLATALGDRARVALRQGEIEQARRDAVTALDEVVRVQAYQPVSDLLDILAAVSVAHANHQVASRLLASASAIREDMGLKGYPVFVADAAAAVATAREALGHDAFESAWAEGAALAREDAIAYARRGCGERRRASTGWESLTPTEVAVAQLVSTGMANKDIATRLFVSVRTVQTHLTHIYAKLGIASRVQLAREAARHTPPQ
ncbi:MAG: LuxR family transcriptional regulator [Mycobacterium kyogaense]|uniref:helix-turn-helix transcriptional regulator n=1 Tax=Mycobacterium kyogaense TaxID=2212479 RepID=UPI002FFD146E